MFAPAIALLGVAVIAPSVKAADERSVLNTYASIAHATYEDSLLTATTLESAVESFLATPSENGLRAARAAWLDARVPYQQTEVFRFGNEIVDEWEGRVNAWPLDEGLIDYVDRSAYGTVSEENPLYASNVIANTSLQFGGETIDATTIDKKLLAESLHEAGEVEANVATGYHAVEFMLWGQDLNGTGAGAGSRPYTDFSLTNCTNGNCERRAAFLRVATSLLIDDLREMVANWAPGGAARKALEDKSGKEGIAVIITGLGSLSYGELAGERMQLGLMLHDPEEEHDCFADNTHNSHFYNQVGMMSVYRGTYRRVDGSIVAGDGLSALLASKSPEIDLTLQAAMSSSRDRLYRIVQSAEMGTAYDQLIASGNDEGNALVQAAIDALKVQAKTLETAVAALDLGQLPFEGSDSLDAPEKVLQ